MLLKGTNILKNQKLKFVLGGNSEVDLFLFKKKTTTTFSGRSSCSILWKAKKGSTRETTVALTNPFYLAPRSDSTDF